MRSQMLALALSLAGLSGCDGGRSNPDARFFWDEIGDGAYACAVQPTLGHPVFVSTMPGDFIDTDRTGSLAGRTVLTIAGHLPSSTAALLDVLVVDYVKPTGGDFELDTAINFDPDAAAAPYVAASYVLGDLDMAALVIGNYYYASSGSITVTAVGETSGAAIKGSVTETNYREIDEQQQDVAGGCTTRLTGLTFDVVHDGMNVAPPTGNPEGLQPLSREEWAAVNAIRANRRM